MALNEYEDIMIKLQLSMFVIIKSQNLPQRNQTIQHPELRLFYANGTANVH